jgi:hypothetical protein
MRSAWLPKAIGFRRRTFLARCMSIHTPIIRISPAFFPVLAFTTRPRQFLDGPPGRREAVPAKPSAPANGFAFVPVTCRFLGRQRRTVEPTVEHEFFSTDATATGICSLSRTVALKRSFRGGGT